MGHGCFVRWQGRDLLDLSPADSFALILSGEVRKWQLRVSQWCCAVVKVLMFAAVLWCLRCGLGRQDELVSDVQSVRLQQIAVENELKNNLFLFWLPKDVRASMPRFLASWARNYIAGLFIYLGECHTS